MSLVLPPRLTASAQSIRDAAQRRGIAVRQLSSFVVPEGLSADHVHAGPSFVDAVVGPLGIAPLEAPADWLTHLPYEFVQRTIRLMPLAHAYALRTPLFIKTPNDKIIRAMIYADGSRLPGPDAIDPATVVLVSDVVRCEAEYRLHILDGVVVTASRYAEHGRLSVGKAGPDAMDFGADLLAAVADTVPSAIVIDVARLDNRWVVVEANAAWGSGCYVSDPDVVLDVVLRSAGPVGAVKDRDRAFIRGVSR